MNAATPEKQLGQEKMIVNSMIARIDVFSGYELKVEFAFDFRQFFEGLDLEVSA